MAIQLGDYVVYGELRNEKNYSTHGYIVLRGALPDDNTVIHLSLTGNCERDLKGKCFRFQPGEDDTKDAIFDIRAFPRFQHHQIGPAGVMTAQGWVRVMPCSVDEYMRRAKLGEPPPTPWKDHLYLEWYGQNGRVLIEMAGALVEEQVRAPEGEDDEGEWQVLLNLAVMPEYVVKGAAAEPEIVEVRRDDMEEAGEEHWSAVPLNEPTDDPEDEDDPLREMILLDACMENGDGEPIREMIGDAAEFPAPESLNDEQVEGELKGLLVRLAMIGVAIDVCDHFTPRDTYRWLRDVILPESKAYPELIGTGWVTHLSTWEDCEACAAEFEDDTIPLEEDTNQDDNIN